MSIIIHNGGLVMGLFAFVAVMAAIAFWPEDEGDD
jgi:hypothetical protein